MEFLEGGRDHDYADIGPWLVAFAVIALVAGLVVTGLGAVIVLVITQSP